MPEGNLPPGDCIDPLARDAGDRPDDPRRWRLNRDRVHHRRDGNWLQSFADRRPAHCPELPQVARTDRPWRRGRSGGPGSLPRSLTGGRERWAMSRAAGNRSQMTTAVAGRTGAGLRGIRSRLLSVGSKPFTHAARPAALLAPCTPRVFHGSGVRRRGRYATGGRDGRWWGRRSSGRSFLRRSAPPAGSDRPA